MQAQGQPTGLWQNADFVKLWLSTSVSLVGSQVTSLALPLTAVLLLKASAAQMGLLGAVQFAPFLLFSLFAGVWIDRLPRRPILIMADLGRLLLVGSIPVAWLSGFLSIEYLYLTGFLSGILTVFFEVASQAYLPGLVQPGQIIEGNTRLEVSRSLAQIGGPGLAGLLVQLMTPPLALLVDAVSFGLSALGAARIKTPEPPLPDSDTSKQAPILAEIKTGVRLLLGNPLTQSLAYCGTTRSFFSSMMAAVLTLFMVQELKFDPLLIGLTTAAGGVGMLIGAVFAARAASRFGLGPALVGGALVVGLANLLIPAAGGPLVLAVALLTAGQFISNLAAPIYGVNQLSLRQRIRPPGSLGRVNATVRFMAWGALGLGSLAGGLVAELIGLRLTLWVGAIGTVFSFLWIFFSPVRSLREVPAN